MACRRMARLGPAVQGPARMPVFLPAPARDDSLILTRISHRIKRIGAPNQRKLFCENDCLMIRGEPRCRQSVSRICLDLKPLKAAK